MVDYIRGNIFNSNADIILVTGNSYVRKDGALVMGRGAAKEMKDRFPSFPYIFGRSILNYSDHLGYYGILITKEDISSDIIYGVFQVKTHFKYTADIELIKRSFGDLSKLLYELEKVLYNKSFSVAMNYPGIGNGKLSPYTVKPIIDKYAPDKLMVHYL